jgi:murein DD-endopeptidase MepM/ murein hydrolase activator NlpD
VVVRHADGRRATYGRLLTVGVAEGQWIGASAPVGWAGTTLHLGLRDGDDYLDPAPLFGVLRGVARLVPLGTTTVRSGRPARLLCPGGGVGGVPSPLR